MDKRTVIPCYRGHYIRRYRRLWTDGQSYLAIADTTSGDTEGYGQTDSHILLSRTLHQEIQKAMDRRTVIPCYRGHYIRRYRRLWTDGQSYLAIADTTSGDTEGYGQTDSHTLLSRILHQEIQKAMDRRTVIPCYRGHYIRRYRRLWTDGQSYLAIADTTSGDTEGYGQTDSHTLL